jgi:glycerol-3-phosphate dehydrogenase (NAD(P)+)
LVFASWLYNLLIMNEQSKVGVIGSGSWATALVKVLLNNINGLNWYIREPEIRDHVIKFKHNPSYLSSVMFETEKLNIFDDINDMIEKTDVLLFVVPSAFLGLWMEPYKGDFKNKFVLSAIKGIIPISNLTIAEYFNRHYNVPFDQLGVVSGPCHAEEVALERLSYLTVACKNTEHAEAFAKNLEGRYIKTVISNDIYGIEYAAVLKNIIALATGICHGLGYGDNFLAVLISNGYKEIKRFLDLTYASKRKTSNSAYMGDLLVTCYSQFSRNRTFGTMIGKGYSVKSTMLEMNMVAEGYYAVSCIKEINKQYNVKMPITDAVYNILYEKISPVVEMRLLSEKLQ